MNKKISIILLLLILIGLYGCNSDKNLEIQNMPINEIKVTDSCNDNDSCTEDRFNQLNQKCENIRLDFCCGNSVCDAGERCNYTVHQTICPQDCSRDCPGFLVLGKVKCEGLCTSNGEGYIVSGDTKFTIPIENLGELSINNIVSGFTCLKENEKPFTSTYLSQENAGVSFKEYFNEDKKSIYLSGLTYEKNKATYTLEITGTPKEELAINCKISIGSSGEHKDTELAINLSKSQ